MTDYFNMEFSENDTRGISNLGLAYLGDAVFELMVRAWLCAHGRVTPKDLHKAAVTYVSAPAQAAAVKKLLPVLTQEETTIYKRGRNTRVNSVPVNASQQEYHMATGLETLFGYLYLRGEVGRVNELFDILMEE